MYLDLFPVSDALLQKEQSHILSLVSLKLNHSTHLFILYNGSIAVEQLLVSSQDLLVIQVIW